MRQLRKEDTGEESQWMRQGEENPNTMHRRLSGKRLKQEVIKQGTQEHKLDKEGREKNVGEKTIRKLNQRK